MKELHAGRFLRMVEEGGWEWVERSNATGVVVIAAITPDDELLLVEQHRVPVGTTVIELPAGLAGDIAGEEDEDMAIAAARELHEETGYEAARMEHIFTGPTSSGMTSEVVTFYAAHDLTRTGEGGGDESEDITVHVVPLAGLAEFIAAREADGALTDPKIYTALYLLR